MNVSEHDIRSSLREARAAARVFRLPFRRELWRGPVGNWAGAGVGTSIDFQDHRPYVPGDDPRYIDWQAYARSDHYVMKLYREEVSPAVDLVFDTSSSMAADEKKKLRSLEVFFFALESSLASGTGLRPWILGSSGAERCSLEGVRDPALFGRGGGQVDPSQLRSIGFRPGSLRVLVSDCLFPGEPDSVLTSLVSAKGRGIVLAPSSSEESDPRWHGQLELEDCETHHRCVEYIDDARLEGYRTAYTRHFQLWETSCRRRGIAFAQLPGEEKLTHALRDHALRALSVELCA